MSDDKKACGVIGAVLHAALENGQVVNFGRHPAGERTGLFSAAAN